MVVVAADVARLGVGDARVAHETGGGAQAAVTAEQAVAHQTGAIVGIRSHGAPGIGLAQLAVSAVDGRAADGLGLRVVRRAAAGTGAAARAAAGIAAGAGAAARVSTGVAAGIALLTALFLLGLATGLFLGRLGGSQSRSLAGGLFLGEKLSRLLGQGVVGFLHLGDEALGLLLDGLGLLGLLGGDVALLLVDGLLGFHLGAQGLGFLHHVGVVLVHIVQEIPVRGEGLERGGSQKKIEERRRAGTVHGAGAVAELVLQLADARGSGIDATLSLVHAGLGIVALGFSRIEGDLGAVELLLHGVELLKCRVGLGLLLGGRDGVSLGGHERGQAQRDAESGRRADEGASAEGTCMLTHIKVSSWLSIWCVGAN